MAKYSYVDQNNDLGKGAGVVYEGARPKYVAADILISPLIRMSFLEERHAKLLSWSIHRKFTRMKMQLTEDEMKSGGNLIFDSLYDIAYVNTISSINGRLLKWVKSNPKSIDVQVGGIPPGVGRERI